MVNPSQLQAHNLSGGQQRKLTVAMALIGDPKLILLDEPTANLDSRARHAVWRMVRERKRRGCAVVLTTHHMVCVLVILYYSTVSAPPPSCERLHC